MNPSYNSLELDILMTDAGKRKRAWPALSLFIRSGSGKYQGVKIK
jgi:hypothetical protein